MEYAVSIYWKDNLCTLHWILSAPQSDALFVQLLHNNSIFLIHPMKAHLSFFVGSGDLSLAAWCKNRCRNTNCTPLKLLEAPVCKWVFAYGLSVCLTKKTPPPSLFHFLVNKIVHVIFVLCNLSMLTNVMSLMDRHSKTGRLTGVIKAMVQVHLSVLVFYEAVIWLLV